MAAERLSMRQIREILRQKWALGLPHRAVAESLRVGVGTISSVLTRAEGAGLDWPQVQLLTDVALESRLYGPPEMAGQRQRPAPDCAGFTPSGASRASPWSSCTWSIWSAIPTAIATRASATCTA